MKTIKSWVLTATVIIGSLIAGAVIHSQYGWTAYRIFIAGVATGGLIAGVGLDRYLSSDEYIKSLAKMYKEESKK